MLRTVAEIWHRNQMINGEIGIEVEVEGENLPDSIPKLPSHPRKFWSTTRDGSLRGEAYEYVLSEPVTRDEVDLSLAQLYRKLDTAKLEDSGRAGIHVHINVQELTLVQTFTFVLLYLVFEKPLVKFCGESREGNLFCLRVSDAEFLASSLMRVIKTQQFNALSTDDLRYSSINLTALRKYGSLEFRAMRSPVKPEVIKQWVTMLLSLKDASLRFQDPEEMILGVSQEGGYDFAKMYLGDSVELLGDVDWRESVLEGIRLIQPIIKMLSLMAKKAHEKPVVKAKPFIMDIDIDAAPWRPMPEVRMAEPVIAAAARPRTRNEFKEQLLNLPWVARNTFTWAEIV